jgi:bacterial/archaeal transporter family-2 protein
MPERYSPGRSPCFIKDYTVFVGGSSPANFWRGFFYHVFSAMDKIIWIVLTLLAGAFLPIQAGLNARLGKAAGNPVYAAMFSFIVGAVGLIVYILITRQTVSWAGLKEAPLSVWIGGLLGAFYVTVIVLAFPRLGPGLTFGLVVAGQMVISLMLEHFDILVAHPSPINYMKVLGIVLIIAGVVILRRF